MNNEIFDYLKKVIKQACPDLTNEITLTQKLKDDLNLDSLGILTIADQVEEKFSIALEAEDLSITPETVNDLVVLIQSKMTA